MTEPSPLPTPADQTTAILVAVTKIDGKLDAALTDLRRYGETQIKHGETLVDHGTRLTVLETQSSSEGEHRQRTFTSRSVFWGAVAAVVGIVGLLITVAVILSARHGG